MKHASQSGASRSPSSSTSTTASSPRRSFEGDDAGTFEECRLQAVEAAETPFFTAESTEEEAGHQGDTDEPVVRQTPEPALLVLGEGPRPSVDRTIVILAALIIIALAAFAAAIFSGRLVGPVQRLTAAADRVRSGDLSARVEIDDPSEIGQLGLAFDKMAAELERSEERRPTVHE